MADPATTSSSPPELFAFTAQIVAAYVAANKVPADALPALICSVHGALGHLGAYSAMPAAPQQEPAVPIKRSIQPEYLVCLEDGAKLKVLTRYLVRFGLTPETYRAKWGLPWDYPMVAPAYSAKRSAMAKQLAVGTGSQTVEHASPADLERQPDRPEERTVQAGQETQHTAASVFANFPGGDVRDRPSPAANDAEKPGRKRFAQQFMRSGRRNVV